MIIKGLHHSAYRCSDSETTRQFYEDFLGLRLAAALNISESKTGREVKVLHSFFEMADGSYLAFFEVPSEPFEFKTQGDYDLHIALEIPPEDLQTWLEKGQAAGIETRGISDHACIDSVYFRDPDGYIVELAGKRANHNELLDPALNGARRILDAWQSAKSG